MSNYIPFKNHVRAVVHSLVQHGIDCGDMGRKEKEAEAIKAIMKAHRLNYTIHFARGMKR